MNHSCTMCGEPVKLVEGYRTPCRCDRYPMTSDTRSATLTELAPRRSQRRPSATESWDWDAAA